jgi:hypothetical protein
MSMYLPAQKTFILNLISHHFLLERYAPDVQLRLECRLLEVCGHADSLAKPLAPLCSSFESSHLTRWHTRVALYASQVQESRAVRNPIGN